ncbi:hypothetical protein B0T21DRAFT_407748 [Apiosordaria backusii]|uniref:Rhodopsin domain-containing protein n=1 Tax=Apiosordaria backusii TaxID=314023 RepID=A0AA40ESF6_9PEZI|nr:hypothetical protein B0T21DRAFT_407748 [Apiosordaria backusii]
MEFVIQPTVIPTNNYIASMVVMNSLTASLVTIRLCTNWRHHKKLFVDDYLTVIGLAFVASYSATSSMMNRSFNSKPEDIEIAFITSLAAACLFTATTAMYFAKLPILIFVMRTFGIHKWLRYTGYSLIVFTALCFFAAAMWTGAHCSPGLHTVNLDFMIKCVDATYYTTVSRNSLSLVVDLVIFVLPLPFVFKLKLSRRKKLGVSLVFLTGSFGIAAAVVSLYYQFGQRTQTSSSITLAMLTTLVSLLYTHTVYNGLTFVTHRIIECCTFLMVSCAPALRLFWSHYFGKSAFAARLGLGMSTTGRSSKRSEIALEGSSWHPSQAIRSAQTPIRVTTDHYVELHDVAQAPVPAYTAKANDQWANRHVWERE